MQCAAASNLLVLSTIGVIEEVAKRAEMKRKDIVDSDNVFSLAISEDPILLAGVMAQSLFGKVSSVDYFN